ncbi:hypothetical protein BGZ83_011893 [Gryganskiella cystojenkinii]|nr:hypothetical protein BGZ83_011893 [Gryganskiella cystojenkinii]
MDQVEINLAVGEFLRPRDLSTCTLVCKKWNVIYTPLLYSEVDTSHHGIPFISPSLDSLKQHARHIRKLTTTYYGPCMDIFKTRSNVIKELYLSDPVPSEPPAPFQPSVIYPTNPVLDLIRRNPRIESASFTSDTEDVPIEILKALVKDSKALKRFAVRDAIVYRDGFGSILDLCQRLTFLDLYCITENTTQVNITRYPDFKTLKTLKLCIIGNDFSAARQLQWIQKCPQIEFLHWDLLLTIPKAKFPTKQFCDLLAKKRFPKLHKLHIELEPQLSDSDLCMIMTDIHRLTELHVPVCNFGPKAFGALKRHFHTLEALDVKGCPNFGSERAQIVLESCPRLQKLSADFLHGQNIVANRLSTSSSSSSSSSTQKKGWVCRGLRVLDVCIIKISQPRWRFEVFTQLGEMTELRELHLGFHKLSSGADWFHKQDNQAPKFRLDCGLDALVGLKHLEQFTFNQLPQNMQEEDVRWIAQAWPFLERITIKMNKDDTKLAKLIQILYQARPGLDLDEVFLPDHGQYREPTPPHRARGGFPDLVANHDGLANLMEAYGDGIVGFGYNGPDGAFEYHNPEPYMAWDELHGHGGHGGGGNYYGQEDFDPSQYDIFDLGGVD